jgi:hypothetical protein
MPDRTRPVVVLTALNYEDPLREADQDDATQPIEAYSAWINGLR